MLKNLAGMTLPMVNSKYSAGPWVDAMTILANNRRMKILYHHRIRSKDGQYVHVEEMINALKALGHEIVLVAPTAIEKEEFGADAGMVAWMKRHLPRMVYELLELSYAGLAFFRLRRAVREHRPDCLYERYNLFMPAGVWLKRRYGLPMLLE